MLIKVHAATVTTGDVAVQRIPAVLFFLFGMFGMKRKKIPGHELAGEIEAVGKDVRLFTKGERVFGTTTGLSVGANAEYVCLPEQRTSGVLAPKPANMSYEEAAAVPVGGMTAIYFLKKANIQSGQSVLVYGASGSVGTYAVQLAKNFGAEVTGICGAANLEMVKSLGADQVIDYMREGFAKSIQPCDVIFDAVGKMPVSALRSALKKGGTVLTVRSSTRENNENLILLQELAEAQKIRAIIGGCYSLEQTAEAYRYVESGHKIGNVVITINHNS